MEIIQNIINFIKDNWVAIGVVLIAFHTFLKALRDAIDKTPASDDNIFEKFVTIMGKVAAYFIGKRSK